MAFKEKCRWNWQEQIGRLRPTCNGVSGAEVGAAARCCVVKAEEEKQHEQHRRGTVEENGAEERDI